MISSCDIGVKLIDLSPASAINVALAFSFFATVQPAWNKYFATRHDHINPFAFAVNAIGDLLSFTKPIEILARVSPTPTIKPLPTSTLHYQSESTFSIFYFVALCAVLILVGAAFTVLRNNVNASLSSVNASFDIGSAGESSDDASVCDEVDVPQDFGGRSNDTPAPNDDPIDPFNGAAESESKLPDNNPSELVDDIGGSPPPPPPPSFTASGMDDESNKKASGFLGKLKMFLIIFLILATFTHGDRIAQKIRPLTTNHHNFIDIPLKFTTGGNTTTVGTVMTSTIDILSGPILSPRSPFVSGSDEKSRSTSLPLPTKGLMSYIPTSTYSISLPHATATPTITHSPSTFAVAIAYTKMFIVFFVFCILVPTLSFSITILPAVIQFIQLSKQRETITHAADKNANEVVLAIEAVENNKVDVNIAHDQVIPVPTLINKALETIEEKDEDETADGPFVSKEGLDPATPTSSTDTDTPADPRRRTRGPRPPRHVRTANKRRRKAEQAAIEAALNAPFI